jgi:hypothetical protein
VLAAVILTIGVATPAVGVPSISKVYRVAKKALRTARTANKGPKVVERQRLDIPAAPNDFAEFDIRCPRGYTAVGIGLGLGALDPTFFASYGNGTLGSMYNSVGHRRRQRRRDLGVRQEPQLHVAVRVGAANQPR